MNESKKSSVKSGSEKYEESEVDSFVIKIETQRTNEPNPFIGMKDKRELEKINKEQKIKSEDNNYAISLLIIVVLLALYYSMITKSRRGVILTKVYNSFCLMLIMIMDRSLNYENLDDFIIDEYIDDDKKQNLLNNEQISSNNGSQTLLQNIIDKKYIDDENKSGLTVTNLKFMMVILGILCFILELLMYTFIKQNNDFNLGIIFCLLSYEYIAIKLYNHIKLKSNLDKENIIGLCGLYILNLSINIMFFDQLTLYLSLLISLLYFAKYLILENLRNQFSSLILNYTIKTDFFVSICFLIYLLINDEFYLLSLSSLIILFFASSCYFIYLKNYKLMDLSIHSIFCPIVGIIDLIINNRQINIYNLLTMLLNCLLLIMTFWNNPNESKIFNFNKKK